MRNELHQYTDVLYRALSVGNTHGTVEKINRAQATRVVQTILRAGSSMELEQNAKTVFACPLECLESIRPSSLGQERLARPRLDRPVRDGQADPAEACTSNLGEVLLGL